METKICTWNVNGIRSRKNLADVFRTVSADVFCIQETKIQRDQIDEGLAFVNNTYESCFAIPKQAGFKGRSGCATYYRESARPNHVELGLFDEDTCSIDWKLHCEQMKEHNSLDDIRNIDSEGRVIVTSHTIWMSKDSKDLEKNQRTLYIFNIYFPRLDPERTDRAKFKDKFNKIVEEKVYFLLRDPQAHVAVGCDLNITHRQIDSCEPVDDSCIYRVWLTHFLTRKEDVTGRHMVDSFRLFNPEKKYAYTCWDARLVGSRQNNYGTRLDIIFVDSELSKHLTKVEHLTDIYGSDHCPIAITLKNVEFSASKDQPLGSTRTWPEYKKRQTSLKSFFTVIPRAKAHQMDKGPEKDSDSTNGKSKSHSDLKVVAIEANPHPFLKPSPSIKKSSQSKCLSAYEIIMQPKAVRPKLASRRPTFCPNHGTICEPKTISKKGANEGRSFMACPAPKCNYFRWAKT